MKKLLLILLILTSLLITSCGGDGDKPDDSDNHGQIQEPADGEDNGGESDASGVFTFANNGAGLTVSLSPDSTEKSIVIPEVHEGQAVTAVGSFGSNGFVTTVTIPAGVTYIEDYAFSGCTALGSIDIHGGIAKVPDHAFSGCTSLVRVNIARGVERIGIGAFEDCEKITRLNLPPTLTRIDDAAFRGCSALSDVRLPESLDSIGDSVFEKCAITKIEIPDGVTVGGRILDECPITEVSIEAQYIDRIALPTLEVLRVTSGFSFCSSLRNCTELREIYLDTKITEMAVDFRPCEKLEAVHISSIDDWCEISFLDGYYSSPTSVGATLYLDGEAVTDVTLSEDCEKLSAYAFAGYKLLISLFVPDTVTDVYVASVSGCTALKSLRLPGGASYTGTHGEDHLISAEEHALTDLEIPVKLLGYITASPIKNLTLISDGSYFVKPDMKYHETLEYLKLVGDFSAECGIDFAFEDCEQLTCAELAEGSTKVPSHAFYGCRSLSRVILPDSITYIGAYAFADCKALSDITLPKSLKTIKENAFRACASLYHVTLPEGLEVIEDSAFLECEKLVEVVNRSSLTLTAGSEDHGCVAFYAKIVTDGESQLIREDGFVFAKIGTYDYVIAYGGTDPSPTLPESFGEGQFYYIYDNAFAYNQTIEEITIPNNVLEVGDYAFYSCKSLKSLTLSELVSNLGAKSFAECTSLEKIYFGCEMLSSLSYNSDAFASAGTLSSGIELTVSKETMTIPSFLFYSEVFPCNIVSIVFEEGSVCHTIGSYAFYNQKNLKTISFGDKIRDIGSYAFYSCSSVESLVLPSALTRIGESAFHYLNLIPRITIPENVTSIGDNAFTWCYGVTEFNFLAKRLSDGSSVGFIFDNFDENDEGIKLFIGKSVEYIPRYFTSTNSKSVISSIEFEEGSSLSAIGSFGFSYTRGVSSIVIPESVSSIGNGAFYGSKFTEIVLPSAIEEIPESAFRYCSELTSVNIPATVTGIGDSAFWGCTGLTSVHINDIAKWCEISFAYSDENPLYYAKNLYLNEELVTNLVIPDGVTSIGSYAFYNCTGIMSVTIGNDVTSIGACAFEYCTGLTSVTIGNDVTSIGACAFEYCTGLTSVTIGKAVTDIGDSAFSGCTGLMSVTIGNDVTSIGDFAFSDCTGLMSVTIGNDVTSIGDFAFSDCYKLVEVINNSILNITAGSSDYGYIACYAKEVHSGESKIVNYNDYLFYTYEGVNYLLGYVGADIELALPESYNGENYEINKHVFEGCTAITNVTIPDSVTGIGDSAFFDCTSLTSVTIGKAVTDIGDSAFSGCTGLTSITIPENIKNLGEFAFSDCTALEEINFNATSMNDLPIGDIDYYVSSAPFNNAGINGNGIRVTIGKNVTKIPSGLFAPQDPLHSYSNDHAPLITTLIFETESVCQNIGDRAFFMCRSLTSVIISDSVTSIGDNAFGYCTSLTDIYYTGSEENFAKITIDVYSNDYFTSAKKHYNYTQEA